MTCNANHGRVLTGAIAIGGRSSLKRRIERLFADTVHLQHGRKALASVFLILFIPALYLSAAAQAPQAPNPAVVSGAPPGWTQAPSLTPEGAAKVEAAVQENPEDLDSRMELLTYYGMHAEDKPFTTHLLWFINNHPETENLAFVQSMFGHSLKKLSDESQARIADAWDDALRLHSNDPAVLYNAVGAFQHSDPERATELSQQAAALDPAHRRKYDDAASVIYATAEVQPLGPQLAFNGIDLSSETAARLRQQLAASNDATLLGATGRVLVRFPSSKSDPQFQRGIELLRQAVKLDPSNTKLTEALESAELDPLPDRNNAPLGAVRIGSGVAEASLLSKPDPIYPPLALQARIQGTVEFNITVGTDGKVQQITLLHGHPILVAAAKDAVLQYVYRPILAEGKVVPFATSVTVRFRFSPPNTP
ncbi:MAG: energy transducer TonB [Bryobacteraceae bacterium]